MKESTTIWHANYFMRSLLVFTVLSPLKISVLAQQGEALSLGGSLTGNQTIISKNGTFALGFFSPDGTSNWYMGIWYAHVPDKNVVWVANRETPFKNTPGLLKLSREGELGLFDADGVSIWWVNGTNKASGAVLLDSGNFVMLGAEGTSESVWESFAHPTDTLLAGMKLGGDRKLISWKNSVDPAPGIFSLVFKRDSSGGLQTVLRWNNSITYWKSGDWNGKGFDDLPEMSATKNYYFSTVDIGSVVYFFYTVRVSFLARFVTEETGQVMVYALIDGKTWTIVFSNPTDPCQVYARCGPFGICDSNTKQYCSCLQGFKQSGVWSGGCTRRTVLDCKADGNRTTDGFIELTGKETPLRAVDSTADNCRQECLRNCSCTAYADAGGRTCRQWFSDLVDVKDAVAGTTDKLFVRVASVDVRKKGSNKRAVAGTAGGAAAVLTLIVALSVLLCFFCRLRQKPRQSSESVPALLTVFSYRELQASTKNFSERLGGGGFGSVFKGTLSDKSLVAVKKLEGFRQGEKQFRTEVSTIGIVQHVNLIRLRGFCSEGSHRLLVYEYMPNGSLNSFLFSKPRKESSTLDWKTRFNIALGTARGILYLHENCRDCIIHCDIKPENILLGSDFCPKVADFGLAKLVGREFSRVLTTMRGTRGYLAPEWVSGLPITPKADVYSFGMTLLEIIAGRRNMETHPESSEMFFPTWAAIQINSGNCLALMDKRVHNEADTEQVERAAMVGGWCIQDEEDARPSMKQIVEILEGKRDVAVPPVPRSLQALVADPNSVMTYWDKEIETAWVSLASPG